MVAQLTGAMQAMPEAIALAALRQDCPIVIADLAADSRWSEYAAAMLQRLPVRSLLAHQVQLSGTVFGVLVLHSTEADFFDAVSRNWPAHWPVRPRWRSGCSPAGSRTATSPSPWRPAGRSVRSLGILMATRKITSDGAFELLKRTSQQAHVKLRAVAREVILTGQLPG